MLKFILKVFLDLEFIQVEDGIIKLKDVSTKRDIASVNIIKVVLIELKLKSYCFMKILIA